MELDKRKTVVNRLESNAREQALLLDTLRMWNEVAEQGIDTDTVVSFTFREDLLTEEDKREIWKFARGRFPTHHATRLCFYTEGKLVRYNAVRLLSGEIVKLSPPVYAPLCRPV